MLYIGGKSIAQATSHTLTISGEQSETTSKDNGGYWKSFEYKSASWIVDCEALVSDSTDGKTEKDLVDAFMNKTTLTVAFGGKTSADAGKTEVPDGGWSAPATGVYKGSVIITSITKNTPNGDNATFSVSFQGTGALTYTPEA